MFDFIKKIKLIPKINLLFAMLSYLLIFTSIFIHSATTSELNLISSYKEYFLNEVNFLIPSPTLKQVELLSAREDINFVEPYIYTDINFKSNSVAAKTEIIIFYNNFIKRKIYGLNYVFDDLNKEFELGADLNFLENSGLKIGDKIEFTIKETIYNQTITHAFYNNPEYPKGVLILDLNDKTKFDIFKNENIYFSSAYISSSNISTTEKYLLDDYKPLGRLGSNFSDQEYNSFIKQDFSNEISNLSIKKQELESNYNNIKVNIIKNTWFLSIILISISLIGILSNNSIPNNRKIYNFLIATNYAKLFNYLKLINRATFLFIEVSVFSYFLFISLIHKNDILLEILVPFILVIGYQIFTLVLFKKPKYSIL